MDKIKLRLGAYYKGAPEDPMGYYALLSLTKKDIEKMLKRANKAYQQEVDRDINLKTWINVQYYKEDGTLIKEAKKAKTVYWGLLAGIDWQTQQMFTKHDYKTLAVGLNTLERYLKFMSMPTDQLALYISRIEDTNLKEYIKERLKQRS